MPAFGKCDSSSERGLRHTSTDQVLICCGFGVSRAKFEVRQCCVSFNEFRDAYEFGLSSDGAGQDGEGKGEFDQDFHGVEFFVEDRSAVSAAFAASFCSFTRTAFTHSIANGGVFLTTKFVRSSRSTLKPP